MHDDMNKHKGRDTWVPEGLQTVVRRLMGSCIRNAMCIPNGFTVASTTRA